ncbi:MAG: hypothetical protein R2912_06210 [Eubacteriales bacterium]
MEKNKRLYVALAIIVVALALFILGMVILPDMIVMQMQKDGSAGTTLPKLPGLLLPFALSSVFPILYYLKGKPKDIVVGLVGIAASGLTFLFNL